MKSAANAEFLVVVAEDDPSVRNAVERVLELEGYQVKTANDGNAALDLIVSSKPHAVVMDVMMPFADGLTVTRELRHRGNRTPVLLLTARHEVGDRVAGLDAGADDYLVKPFAVDELLARTSPTRITNVGCSYVHWRSIHGCKQARSEAWRQST